MRARNGLRRARSSCLAGKCCIRDERTHEHILGRLDEYLSPSGHREIHSLSGAKAIVRNAITGRTVLHALRKCGHSVARYACHYAIISYSMSMLRKTFLHLYFLQISKDKVFSMLTRSWRKHHKLYNYINIYIDSKMKISGS